MSRLSAKIAEHIEGRAQLFHAPPVWTANECELTAEVQRLDAENAGLRRALEALRGGDDTELAKDLQAVRDACADRIEGTVNDSTGTKDLIKRLADLVITMRMRG